MKYGLFVFVLLICERVYPQNTKVGNNDKEVLFRVHSKVGGRYVLLNGDTAFYEVLQRDKVPYFIVRDTLIRSDDQSKLYHGTKSKMNLTDTVIRLTMNVTGKKNENSFVFLPATSKQIGEWNSAKNRENYYRVNDIVNKTLYTTQPGPDLRKSIETEWKDISKYILTLNHKEFDSVLTTFKNKYSIK